MAPEVLVVEDEPDIRALIVHHLTQDGFRCRTAADGTEALTRLRAAAPDLIVLDLMLPGIDGLEVTRRVRAAPAWAAVPIIMLTAKAEEFDLLHALMASAGRVLSREFLLNRVWGYARADEIESRTVDVHVRRLRAKLGAAGRRIATVKSVGYRFESE